MKKIEIKDSHKFQIAGRDIHIHHPPRQKKLINLKIPSKENILDFLIIYPEVWYSFFKPHAIINRIVGGYPKINSLLACLLSMIVATSVFMFYISQVEVSRSFSMDVAWLKGKALALIMPFSLVVLLLQVSLSSFFVHQIYKRFGGRVSYLETLSFNLYFFAAWIVFLIVGAQYTGHMYTVSNGRVDLLSLVLLVVLIYSFVSYIATLNIMMHVSHMKGVIACTLVLMIHLVIVWPLFRLV